MMQRYKACAGYVVYRAIVISMSNMSRESLVCEQTLCGKGCQARQLRYCYSKNFRNIRNLWYFGSYTGINFWRTESASG